jgi:hypothetical protein
MVGPQAVIVSFISYIFVAFLPAWHMRVPFQFKKVSGWHDSSIYYYARPYIAGDRPIPGA